MGEFVLAVAGEECGCLFLGHVAGRAGGGGDGVGLEAFLALALRLVQGGTQAVGFAVGRAPYITSLLGAGFVLQDGRAQVGAVFGVEEFDGAFLARHPAHDPAGGW
ncbi:hypothetical protein [Streptomyces sp. NPDC048825]|uniref:hypothetical protein n=1 Tax=Streptomyces sp. NPDC048825 TaxID=3365592 RepID=UPI00370FD417